MKVTVTLDGDSVAKNEILAKVGLYDIYGDSVGTPSQPVSIVA